MPDLPVIPYPQHVTALGGRLRAGPPRYEATSDTPTVRLARRSLSAYLPGSGAPIRVRLGSLEEGYSPSWLADRDRAWLKSQASPEASVLRIEPSGITVVGVGRWGMLYGTQTVNQLLAAGPNLPCLAARDWPDLRWRCLSPQMTWYSGYNRLEGYDCGNWTLDEWKWLADWSLLHKFNGWALCMYGNWPFTLPGYEETTLDVPSLRWNPITGLKEPYRFVHRNIRKEFLPDLIRYANERGIRVYAYIGKNSFNGTYGLKHPDADAGGAAELIPFHPGVGEYWDAVIRRITELGFNGYVFEDPEALHVPNRNEQCWRTFWEPWAAQYGFRSAAETDANKPPLGVHVEYYTWLFRTFDGLLRRHAREMGKPEPEVYLISHVLLSRIVSESRTQEERDRWFALIDRKHDRKVPFVILEADESKYVSFLGRDRVASLGGRGGSCTNAMRRIASINNNWVRGGMGGDLAYERQCQRRIFEAGGFGAMAYVFEWTNTEPFGYVGAQYLWRSAGIPGIDNDGQTGLLYRACRLHYGDRAGELAARAFDEGPCVNDAMMLEGIHGSQYPETGAPLHRDYQYLGVLADRAAATARRAYVAYAAHAPSLTRPVYSQEAFRWSGYDREADRRFKEESLRRLYISAVRSRHMCDAVLAHRQAQRLIADGANCGAVLAAYDRAIAKARESERLYQVNYDDDYDWTDGLCSKVTEALVNERGQFIASVSSRTAVVHEWTFEHGEVGGWAQAHDATTPTVVGGDLVVRATGPDAFIVRVADLGEHVSPRCFIEVRLTSDRPGRLRFFWATRADLAALPPGAYPFSETRVRSLEVVRGEGLYRLTPDWDGSLAALRLDIPRGSEVRFRSIRIVSLPSAGELSTIEAARPTPPEARAGARKPLRIPWARVGDIVPRHPRASAPGRYVSVSLGCDARQDYYRLGVVFCVEARAGGGPWTTLFRRSLGRRHVGWECWDIPLGRLGVKGRLSVRFVTDCYSRAQDRSAPSWRWPLWGRPRIVEVAAGGSRRVLADLARRIGSVERLVRMDADGYEKPFSDGLRDRSGAVFATAEPGIIAALKAGELRDRQWVNGFAAWLTEPAHRGVYKCWLGDIVSGWAYREEVGAPAWRTAPAPRRAPTAVAWIGGTGYASGSGELWLGGRKLLSFDMARPSDAIWKGGGAELRYYHGGDTRSPEITYGISGIYVLLLPPEMVEPRKPLNLQVRLPAGAGDWYMVHEYPDPGQACSMAAIPEPRMPCIAAFPPHIGGEQGVTIGQWALNLP